MRLAMFAAMAALLVVALCVPEAFGDDGAAVRVRLRGRPRARRSCCSSLASRDDPSLRQSVVGAGRQHGDRRRPARRRRRSPTARCRARSGRSRWCSTWAGRYFFGSRAGGWSPSHFAERHGLIVHHRARRVDRRDRRRRRGRASTPASSVAAVLGTVVAAALWWLYFDVVALVAERRLAERGAGPRAQRDRARLLLLPALPDGRRDRAGRARAQEDARPRRRARWSSCPPSALLGGAALYLLAHVAFRWRNMHRFSSAAAARARSCCVALIPVAVERARAGRAGAARGAAGGADRLRGVRFAELRERLRHPASAAG